jgi:malonyl-CoA/methylmalonyl-CoA synthetase
VLTTQAALSAQAGMLVEAWGWQPSDRVLLSLPLHHVHGLVNVVQCALVSGATCEIGGRFDAERVWSALTRHAETPERLSLYMAVPTVYAKLLEHFDVSRALLSELFARDSCAHTAAAETRRRDAATAQYFHQSGPHVASPFSRSHSLTHPHAQTRSLLLPSYLMARPAQCSGLRLMVSGSSTLPVPVFNRWREATGHTLLERYGMTEFGMALSNPLSGERIAGSVGACGAEVCARA